MRFAVRFQRQNGAPRFQQLFRILKRLHFRSHFTTSGPTSRMKLSCRNAKASPDRAVGIREGDTLASARGFVLRSLLVSFVVSGLCRLNVTCRVLPFSAYSSIAGRQCLCSAHARPRRYSPLPYNTVWLLWPADGLVYWPTLT